MTTSYNENDLREFLVATDADFEDYDYSFYNIIAELEALDYDEDTHDAQFLDSVIAKHKTLKEAPTNSATELRAMLASFGRF